MNVRRPRYMGAEDIGSWQSVLTFISWVALPINVLILVFTSWSFRDYIMIPWVANFEETCANATDPMTIHGLGGDTILSPTAFIGTHAQHDGTTVSYLSKCMPNVRDCYANVGGEPWLPAHVYLNANMTTTVKYIDALCDADFPAPTDPAIPGLYNELHCNACRNWMNDVWRWQLFAALVVEHLLLLVKMLIAFIIPDEPGWVTEANARKQFMLQMKDTKQRRKTSVAIVNPETKDKETKTIIESINSSDDVDDKKQGPGALMNAKV